MSKQWKPGDVGYIFANEMSGITFLKPEKVQIISILAGDLHPVKVKSLSSGSIYYCTEKEIQTRAAKAERKPADMVLPEAIKKEAEKMAEKRMDEIKDKLRPEFKDICDKFYAICIIGESNKGSGTEEMADTVIKLAERALYEEIKDGCRWSS